MESSESLLFLVFGCANSIIELAQVGRTTNKQKATKKQQQPIHRNKYQMCKCLVFALYRPRCFDCNSNANTDGEKKKKNVTCN